MAADAVPAPGAWSRWSPAAEASAWTVGVEEEVMLLDPNGWALASRADAVMSGLTGELASHTSTETHGSALELRTDPHETVAGGLAQLEELRGDLARELEPLELRAAVAGLHPFTLWQDTQISEGDRYRFLYGSMRELARREPTFALHVHVAVPDPESALRAINRLRSHLPLLLALSANSPFWQGRETGLASARTPLFPGLSRASASRAPSSTTPTTSARSTCCCAARPFPSRRSCGGTPACSRASARSRCASWTRRRPSPTPPR